MVKAYYGLAVQCFGLIRARYVLQYIAYDIGAVAIVVGKDDGFEIIHFRVFIYRRITKDTGMAHSALYKIPIGFIRLYGMGFAPN